MTTHAISQLSIKGLLKVASNTQCEGLKKMEDLGSKRRAKQDCDIPPSAQDNYINIWNKGLPFSFLAVVDPFSLWISHNS